MDDPLLGVPWAVWAVLAAAVAVLFAFVPPARPVSGTTRAQRVVLRWAHPLVWALLAVSFGLRAAGPQVSSLAGPVAALAGLCYLMFVVVLLRTRR